MTDSRASTGAGGEVSSRRLPRPGGTTYIKAILEAQREELRRDPATIIIGEDLSRDVYGTSTGFLDEFGPARVRDVPLSENGFVGAAIGAAMTGLRPIVDITAASFLFLCADQIINQAAKNRYMFGGQTTIPLTIRATMFTSGNVGAHHSDRPYPMFMGYPGLKIVAPSSPSDAKGLLKSAIRADDPVLCFEDVSLLTSREEIPEGDHLVPLGVAAVRRAGTDVTLVAISRCVPESLRAADELAEVDGISVEVIDPRTLVPMDWEAISRSVMKTGRLVVVDPANRTCGAAAEIAATVAEDLFGHLMAPIKRVTTPDVHFPFSSVLERRLLPDTGRIVESVRAAIGGRG